MDCSVLDIVILMTINRRGTHKKKAELILRLFSRLLKESHAWNQVIRLLLAIQYYSMVIFVRTGESLPLKFEKVLVRLSLCYCFISNSYSIIFLVVVSRKS